MSASSSSQARILVLGAGSAGRRHARNLCSLGAAVTCFDPRSDRLAQVQEEIPGAEVVRSFDEALHEGDGYVGAVVASPPSFHVDQALACLDRRLPILLEKPISPDLASARRLEAAVQQANGRLLLGYTYRWWPPLVTLRQQVQRGRIGKVRHARFVMSAHLADWHPWERYQDFFMASRELGGGALLDESHFIDLMIWFFGVPEAISGRVERLSDLQISTDDNVDLIAIFEDRCRATIHLDLFGRPHEKSVTVVGEHGTLQCLFDPNALRFSDRQAGSWETTAFGCERNEMFLAVARDFLALAAGEPVGRCTVADGVQALRCVEAARRSSAEGRTIPLASV